MTYHTPVMLKECIEGLNINPKGIYVDLTFGGGGHSEAILDKLVDGKLFSFDQDDDAINNAEKIKNRSFTFINSNSCYFKKFLRAHAIQKVDGILADLGVSSHQFDTPNRGFSTRFDGELDMRMDMSSSLTAKKIINNYKAYELQTIFSRYGEVRNAKTLANAILMKRTNNPINTISELREIVVRYAPKKSENKYLAQVFQALRIEVNNELEVLKDILNQVEEVLSPNGRLVVMSYHSLEDRLVKNFINKGNVEGKEEKDFYGNVIRALKPISRKPITPSEEEIQKNSRARSAKLRIGEKI